MFEVKKWNTNALSYFFKCLCGKKYFNIDTSLVIYVWSKKVIETRWNTIALAYFSLTSVRKNVF